MSAHRSLLHWQVKLMLLMRVVEEKVQCWQEDGLLGLAASVSIHYTIWLALALCFLVGNSDLGVRWVDFCNDPSIHEDSEFMH